MPESGQPILTVHSLSAGYGGKRVVNDFSVAVSRGEILALIGHNGAGKSTLLKALFGLLPSVSGQVTFAGREIQHLSPCERIGLGMTYRPQGQKVFAGLSVRENLEISDTFSDKEALAERQEKVLGQFPELRALYLRRAGTLSGGERQLLSLACALISQPRLLFLDEPALGLASTLVKRSLERIQRLCRQEGVTALIAEQKVREVLAIADRVVLLRNGRISFSGAAFELQADQKLREVYF